LLQLLPRYQLTVVRQLRSILAHVLPCSTFLLFACESVESFLGFLVEAFTDAGAVAGADLRLRLPRIHLGRFGRAVFSAWSDIIISNSQEQTASGLTSIKSSVCCGQNHRRQVVPLPGASGPAR
jgi:hypothetical protein